jgi:DNA polymerase-3 subunit epsilon
MICFIDFETTGIDIFRDEPIDFGAVLVDNDLKPIKEFSSKIALQKNVYFTKRAFNIHNITEEDLIEAPSQKQVLDNFFEEFGTNYRLGGWNISFDVSFLRKMCNKNGMMVNFNKINHRHIDTQTLGFLINELNLIAESNNSLNDWINYFGYNRMQNHSAIDDAKLTYKVYKELVALIKGKLK